MSEIRPHRIDVPQADIDDLRYRLDRVCWAQEVDGSGWDYGSPVRLLPAREVAFAAETIEWNADVPRGHAFFGRGCQDHSWVAMTTPDGSRYTARLRYLAKLRTQAARTPRRANA